MAFYIGRSESFENGERRHFTHCYWGEAAGRPFRRAEIRTLACRGHDVETEDAGPALAKQGWRLTDEALWICPTHARLL